MMREIDEWLEDQADAGTAESVGEFTIDPARAWTKLGASGLPTTYSWVLKLVQSAVRSKTGLDVQQTREESVFTWGGPQPWTHEQLAGAIFSVEGCQEDLALNYLAVAVRALAASRCEFKFWIQYSDGVRAEWTGSGFEMSSRRVSSSFPMSLGVGHKITGEDGTPIQLAGVGAEIANILCRHCQWSPRKITLDQREISNVFEDLSFGRSSGYQPLCLLASPASQDGPNLRVRARFSDASKGAKLNVRPDPNALARATRSLASSVSAVGLVTYSSSRTRISQFAWVLDGVEIFREALPFAKDSIAFLGACSAEGLETDISGMTLRDTPEKRSRLLGALGKLAQCFEDGGGAMSEYPRETSSAPVVVGGVGFGFGLLTCLVSPVGGVLVIGGSFMGVLAAALSSDGHENGPNDVARIRREVQKFSASLAERVSAWKKL